MQENMVPETLKQVQQGLKQCLNPNCRVNFPEISLYCPNCDQYTPIEIGKEIVINIVNQGINKGLNLYMRNDSSDIEESMY